jgi:hypothetical protein
MTLCAKVKSMKKVNRKRAAALTVMLTDQERQQLNREAEKAGVAPSLFMRVMTFAAIKRGETLTSAKA